VDFADNRGPGGKAKVPHLQFPFRWSAAGNAVELEQDSEDEIANGVDPNPAVLEAKIEKWEPRAHVSIEFHGVGDDGTADYEITLKPST
jgi:hypothetical protein